MKLVFISNYFNHHQKPFCDEMYQKLGADFTFISTTVMREERRKLGYGQGETPPYVLLSYENEQKRSQAISLINEADAVIAGGVPNEFLLERIKRNQLLLRYAERPFKKPKSCLKKFYHALAFRKRDLFKRNVYMLCASAYATQDYASVGAYRNRTYKWGYFPAVKAYDVDALLSKKKSNTIMWCGRFIDWKHPDDAIVLARKLKDAGCDFQLNMVGTGEMEAQLHQLAEELHVSDCVHFLGSMPPEQVRAHMESAGIYLHTSDRQEGWGAVLNESMNSGCAVVASHAIGSVPFLLRDGENGAIYQSGDLDMLFDKVKYLLKYPAMQADYGHAAYQTMIDMWNAGVAADRILQLIERLLAGEKHPCLFETGPCSVAKNIKNNGY